MTQDIKKQRDLSLDVAKGIGITMMVIGHAACPERLSDFIYFFHVPCFFFFSGILLSDRCLDDPRTGIMKKLKGYYKPFVKWELIFLLLHNAFAAIHVIAAEPYGWSEILDRAWRTIFMTRGEQLVGGYWFLISLTWASIGSILLLVLLKKCNYLNVKVIGGGILLTLAFASVEHLLPFNVPTQFRSQTVLGLAFFLSGYVYKKLTKGVEPKRMRPLMLLLLVPFFATFVWHASIGHTDELSWLFYAIASCGIIGLLQLTKTMHHGCVASMFNYIGNKTLYVLTFHFLSFKLVSLVWLWTHGEPLERLSEFPVLTGTNSWLWVPYTIVGVAVPLVLWEAKERLLRLFARRG